MYLFPLVDVEAVILQFLLQNIRNADVDKDNLLLTFPFDINVWFYSLKQARYKPLDAAFIIFDFSIQELINIFCRMYYFNLKAPCEMQFKGIKAFCSVGL